MNTVLLIRHGENPANLTKQFSCREVDYSLTPKGVLQAQQTAHFLRDRQVDEIYASPLKRTRETAQIIGEALGKPVVIREEFREIDVGELERRPVSPESWQLHDSIIQAWHAGDHGMRFPAGEDYHTLLGRMRAGLTAATVGKSGRTIVVVGHGGIFSAPIQGICPAADATWVWQQRNDNCSITELTLQPDPHHGVTGTLVDWANTGHLHGQAANLVQGWPDPADDPD